MVQKDIPSIDMNLDPLNDEAKSETVLKIKEACFSTGFFSKSNYVIPKEILEDCWKSSIQFFRQSESEKMKVGMPFHGYPYGFVAMEKETLARSKRESAAPDLKESFSVVSSPPYLVHLFSESRVKP